MNGSSKLIEDQNYKALLATQFNAFYLDITSPKVSQVGNYRIIQEIGEGSFGKVYLANHILLDINVVLKCGAIDDPNIVREIYYHKQLKHKNIVSLYEVIKTENHLWIVLEYCEGSELFFLIYEKKQIELNECQNLFFQIVMAVKYVHSLNLSHRDLKLENILLADAKKSIVKLTDFGFVREFNPKNRKFLSTVCGTVVYMAPELLKSEKYSGFSVDIWSLGIILFTMLYGEMPFDEDDDLKTKFKILNEEPRYRDIIPQDLQLLIKKMLSKDPNQRPSLNEILNSSFLIKLHNKHLDKSTKKHSLDAESILSINQHYNSSKQPFQSKIEKEILKKLEKLNVNINSLQSNVYANEMNPLTALYELLLTREFSRKKKKYYRDLRNGYEKSKKRRSRVRSALSLTELATNATSQPLERIISSLSIASKTGGKAKDSRRSLETERKIESQLMIGIDDKKRMDSRLSRNSVIGGIDDKRRADSQLSRNSIIGAPDIEHKRINSLLSRNSLIGTSKYERRISSGITISTPSTPRALISSDQGIGQSPIGQEGRMDEVNPIEFHVAAPGQTKQNQFRSNQLEPYFNDTLALERTVSFFTEEPIRKLSNATTTITASTTDSPKKLRNVKLKNMLQFWKKSKKEDSKDSNSNFSGNSQKDEEVRESKRSTPSPRSSHKDRSRSFDKDSGYNNRKVSYDTHGNPYDETAYNGKLPELPIVTSSNVYNPGKSENEVANVNDSPVAFVDLLPSPHSDHLDSPDSPQVTEPLSTRMNRTRPSSMVSQISQISHLSQMSTMMSESELDILDETDTMDEYYDDDDVMSTSSANASQDFGRLSIPMAHTSSTVLNPSVKPTPKKPSYRRTLSSDVSIKSTSTTATTNKNKKFSLSQVSSNSSDESSVRSNPNTNYITPTPMKIQNNDLDSTLSQVQIARSTSPDLIKNNKRFKNPIFSNGIASIGENVNSSNTGNSAFSGNILNPGPITPSTSISKGAFQFADKEPFYRSASPPVSKKFSKMKLIKPVKIVLEKGSHLTNNSSLTTKLNEEKWNTVNTPNTHPPKSTMYGPVINEEEEDDY